MNTFSTIFYFKHLYKFHVTHLLKGPSIIVCKRLSSSNLEVNPAVETCLPIGVGLGRSPGGSGWKTFDYTRRND